MGKNTEKTKRNLGFIEIILLVISVILSYLTYKNYLILENENKKKNDYAIQIENLKKEYDNNLSNKEKLVNEKQKLDNINDSVLELKEQVFELAKQLELKIKDKKTDYKIAYLTFDDGPYYSTDKVLEILDKYKIKATFFTIGLNKDICYDNKNYSCEKTYKKIVDKGHTIANHTYSHAIFSGLYGSTDLFMIQVKKQEELIKCITLI